MVVRVSSMEVPAARFDEGGGGKVQELLGSMEVLKNEQIERFSLGDALLEEENCRCGSGQGRSLGALGEVLLEVVDGDVWVPRRAAARRRQRRERRRGSGEGLVPRFDPDQAGPRLHGLVGWKWLRERIGQMGFGGIPRWDLSATAGGGSLEIRWCV